MRTILVFILLPGIFAYPLEEDHGTQFNQEKRCLLNDCTLAPNLPYPPGFNENTCPDDIIGNNPYAMGLSVAPKKRSTIFTTMHANHTDAPSPVQKRQPRVCRAVAYARHLTDFRGPSGNTAEILIRHGVTYWFAFTFDTVVETVIIWGHPGGDDFFDMQGTNFHDYSGIIQVQTDEDVHIHFHLQFGYDMAYQTVFGENNINLNINGDLALFEMD